jgi:hypothetical protein
MASQPHHPITTHPEYVRVYQHYVREGSEPWVAARLAYEHMQRFVATDPVVARGQAGRANPAVLVVAVVVGVLAFCGFGGVVAVLAAGTAAKTTTSATDDSSHPGFSARSTPQPAPTEPLELPATELPAPEPEPEPVEPPVAPGPGPNSVPGDGTFLVPSEAKPGTYRSAGGDICYWARLKGTSGSMDELLANGLPSGPAVVTIMPGDKAFETRGCGQWTPVR